MYRQTKAKTLHDVTMIVTTKLFFTFVRRCISVCALFASENTNVGVVADSRKNTAHLQAHTGVVFSIARPRADKDPVIHTGYAHGVIRAPTLRCIVSRNVSKGARQRSRIFHVGKTLAY